MQRAVIDTNVWISALLNPNGAPAQVLKAFLEGQFVSITSDPLLIELDEVLARPRIAGKYEISPEDRETFVDLLRGGSIVTPIDGTVRLCRDPDDDVVIETALRGSAHMLVSRDDDLKGATEVVTHLETMGVQVLSVRRFLAMVD